MSDVTTAYAGRAAEYTELLGSMSAVHPSDRQLVESWADAVTGRALDAWIVVVELLLCSVKNAFSAQLSGDHCMASVRARILFRARGSSPEKLAWQSSGRFDEPGSRI